MIGIVLACLASIVQSRAYFVPINEKLVSVEPDGDYGSAKRVKEYTFDELDYENSSSEGFYNSGNRIMKKRRDDYNNGDYKIN